MDKLRVRAVPILPLLSALLLFALAAPARAQTDADLSFLSGATDLPPNVLILFDTSASMKQIVWAPGFNPDKFYDRGAPTGLGTGVECGLPAVKVGTDSLPVYYDPYISFGSGTFTQKGYTDVDGASSSFTVTCSSTSGASWGAGSPLVNGANALPACAAWNAVFPGKCTPTGSPIPTSMTFKLVDVDASTDSTYWNLNYLHYVFYTLRTTGALPAGFVAQTRIMVGKTAVKDMINGTLADPNTGFNRDVAVGGDCPASPATPTYKQRVRFGLARYRGDTSNIYGHGYGSYVVQPISECNKTALLGASPGYTGGALGALSAQDKFTPLKTALIDAGRYFTGQYRKLGSTGTGTGTGGYTLYNMGTGSSGSGTTLTSPLDPNKPCRNNFIVYITDGAANNDCPDDSSRGDTSIGSCGPSGSTTGSALTGLSTNHVFYKTFLNNGASSWSWEPGREQDGGAAGTDKLDTVTYYLAHATRLGTPDDATATLTPYLTQPMITRIPTSIIGFSIHDPALETAAKRGDGFYGTAQDGAALTAKLVQSVDEILLRNKTFAAASVPSARLNSGLTFFRSFFNTQPLGAMYDGHVMSYAIGNRQKPSIEIKTGPPANCTLQLPNNWRDPNNPSKPLNYIDPNDPNYATLSALNLATAPTAIILGGTVNPDGSLNCQFATDLADPNGTGVFLDSVPPIWDAQTQITDPNTRTMYVALGADPNGLNQFDTSNAALTVAAMNLDPNDVGQYPNDPNDAVNYNDPNKLRDALIKYARGADAFNEDRDTGPTSKTERRKAALGDVFHSSPVVVGGPSSFLDSEIGVDDTTGTSFYAQHYRRNRVLYAGANDGFLHAFDAGTYQDPDPNKPSDEYYSWGTGAERFGYMPKFLVKHIREMTRLPKPFFVDGSPAAADAWIPPSSVSANADPNYVKQASEWSTVLVSGMHNGENGYFALDVTKAGGTGQLAEANKPYPKWLWEFTQASDANLGRTWSKPVLTRVKLDRSGHGDKCGPEDTTDGNCIETWVAIFGAGYKDVADPSLTASPSGTVATGVYMVALATGNLIAYRPTTAGCAVAADPAVVDWNADGFADLVYIGDLCGTLWKWDISKKGNPTGNPKLVPNSDWPIGKFFSVPAGTGTPAHKRQIFATPSISQVNGALTLVFGTGERTLLGYSNVVNTDENGLYVIRDPQPLGTTADPNAGIPASPYTPSNLTVINGAAQDTDTGSTTGSIDLGYRFKGIATEKYIGSPIAFEGKLVVTSYVSNASNANACKAQGSARAYIFEIATGKGVAKKDSNPDEARYVSLGGGLPLNPSVSTQGDEVQIMIQTSDGRVVTQNGGPSSKNTDVLYWRQSN